MGEIKRVYVENDLVNLKRDILGWRVVYPIKKEDGSINWFNLIIGGWGNSISVLFILLLTGIFYWVYQHDTFLMRDIVADPCKFCVSSYEQIKNGIIVP